MEVVAIVLWLVCAAIIGVMAQARDRDGTGWFLLSVLISPLFGLLLLIAAGENRAAQCPHCAERIKPRAKICPRCRSDLVAPRIQIEGRRRGFFGR